jgi:hypothetical protein
MACFVRFQIARYLRFVVVVPTVELALNEHYITRPELALDFTKYVLSSFKILFVYRLLLVGHC